MPQKILFIESNTTGTGMLALKKVKSWGLTPVFFTNDLSRYDGFQNMNCEIIICDTNNYENLVICIKQNVNLEELCAITTTSDFYLEIAAQIAEAFKLEGNPVSAIRNARNKWFTRNILTESNINQPRYAVIKTEAEMVEVVKHIGLPCILKPIEDSASSHVKLCTTLIEAEEHVRKILNIKKNVRGQTTNGIVLVEEYIDAREYSVEMFTWQGQNTCIGITQKSLTGYPYFVEYNHLFPAAISQSEHDSIQETVNRTIKALGIQTGSTHTEVKLTEDGPKIIEVNARLAGGMIPELIKSVTGIDMLEQQLLSSMGRNNLPEKIEYNGAAGIQFIVAPEDGTLQSIENVKQVRSMDQVQHLYISKTPGHQVNRPQSAYDRLGYVILHMSNADEVLTSFHTIEKLLEVKVRE